MCRVGIYVAGVVKLFLEYEMRSQMETAELKGFLLYLTPLLTAGAQCARSAHNADQVKGLTPAIYGALSQNANVWRKQRDSATRQEMAQGDVAHLHESMLVRTQCTRFWCSYLQAVGHRA